jgi:hypothetical protein
MLIARRRWELRAPHPDITIRLMGDIPSTSLARRESDIAIRWGRPAEKRAVARKVGSVTFGRYASSAYPARHSPARRRVAEPGVAQGHRRFAADGVPRQ